MSERSYEATNGLFEEIYNSEAVYALYDKLNVISDNCVNYAYVHELENAFIQVLRNAISVSYNQGISDQK